MHDILINKKNNELSRKKT